MNFIIIRETYDYEWPSVSDFHRENTTAIEIINRIEDDELVYHEELIQEKEELKQEMINRLALQRKNSVSARFKKRQKAQVEQEELENRWKKIQVRTHLL